MTEAAPKRQTSERLISMLICFESRKKPLCSVWRERRLITCCTQSLGSSVCTNNTMSFLYLEFVVGLLVGFVDVNVCRKLAVQLSQGQSGVTTGVGLENDLVKELVLRLLTYNTLWARWIGLENDLLTYNNTLIYNHDGAGWHTTRHRSTITMVQASRHVVSELTGCYSWLTGCRHQVSPARNVISGFKMSTVTTVTCNNALICTKCDTGFKNVYRDYRRLTSWMNLFHTCWHATMHWSTVVTAMDSTMISWRNLYCIVLVHVKWQLVLHLFT